MTTLAQLDKFADKWFCNRMRRRGFAVEKKLYFWRKRGPLFDVFWSEVIAGGTMLRVHATILSPWVDDPVCGEFTRFPVAELMIGGTLSESFPETMQGGAFEVSNESDFEASFTTLLEYIDTRALPWFKSVNSYDAYISYVGRRGFHPSPEYREKIKAGIAIGFERESFL
jgi:hypothetical protein